MNSSTPGLPVHHKLPEFTQTHVHWVGDAIQPFSSSVVPFSSCPQSFPSGSFLMSQLFASGLQVIWILRIKWHIVRGNQQMDDRTRCVVGTSFVPNNSAVIFSGLDLASPVCRCLVDRCLWGMTWVGRGYEIKKCPRFCIVIPWFDLWRPGLAVIKQSALRAMACALLSRGKWNHGLHCVSFGEMPVKE